MSSLLVALLFGTPLLTVPAHAQLLPQEPPAAAPTVTPEPGDVRIDEIIVLGLSSMSREALLFRLDIKERQPYDPIKIRRNFRSLWELGVLEDIAIDVEDAATGGKAIIIRVQERPKISSITFEENSVLSQTEIEDELERREIQLKAQRPVDMGEVARAQTAIRDLLAFRGYLGGEVRADIRRVTETARSINFKITPGGKTRIRKIDFDGNELYKDRQLIGALELTKPRRWYYPWSSKNLYFQPKWDQDVGNIRNLYENRGYLDVSISPPVVEVRTKGGELVEPSDPVIEVKDPEPIVMPDAPEIPEGTSDKKRRRILDRYEKKKEKAEKKRRKRERKAAKKGSKRWVHLTVRISEGEPYTLGEVTFSGNEVFTDDQLARSIPIRKGSVYNKGDRRPGCPADHPGLRESRSPLRQHRRQPRPEPRDPGGRRRDLDLGRQRLHRRPHRVRREPEDAGHRAPARGSAARGPDLQP